jgi:ABC-type antimicrobial peptide transport system permease subunit
MASESGKVVYRRFMGRIIESGLLIIAVALGVGAASAGFSLLANTMSSGKKMLDTVTYRELVVSTRSNADEMSEPATVKGAGAAAVLTSADLDAASLVPDIEYSYVRNGDNLPFINSASVQNQAAFAGSHGSQSAPSGQSGGFSGSQGGPMTADDLAKAKAQADIVVVDGITRLNGYAVTAQFFDAWKMKAAQGSLLSDSDSDPSNSARSVVLGASVARKIAGEGKDPSSLLGKKLLTFNGYAQVVGVLESTGQTAFDESFFSAYKAPGAGVQLRQGQFNTQLRFTVADASKLNQAEELLSGWFTSRFGENQIVISNPRSEAQKLIARNAGIGLLILFLSISALFIALVNVSHILMSRGLRMRKGVGIMMALGASRGSVLRLFASEATAISAVGALLGGVFAMPLSRSMQSALGLSGGSWIYVILGIILSWIFTLAFSVVPTWQNSRIVPAVAMRAA